VGNGGAAFGQDAGQRGAGAEGGAQFGLDQPVDEQGAICEGIEDKEAVSSGTMPGSFLVILYLCACSSSFARLPLP